MINIRKKKTITKILDMPETLRKARSLGVKGMFESISNIYTETVVGHIIRALLVFLQFIFAFGSFITNVAKYLSTDDKDQLLQASLVINCIIMLFTSLDFVYNVCFHPCRIWKEFKKYQKPGNTAMYTLNSDKEKGTSEEEQPIDSDQCCQDTCKCCPKDFTTKIDLIRLIFATLFFYPELVVSVLQFSKEYVDEGDSAMKISVLTWMQELVSFAQTLFSIYISRAFILFGTVWSIAMVSNRKWNAAIFHISFVMYFCCQMLLQVFMIIAIGVRFYYEYEDHSKRNESIKDDVIVDSEEDYRISVPLWYMMFLGYILPIVSTLMFFLVHHYWTQKFPMEFLQDFFLLITKEPGKLEAFKFRTNAKGYTSTMEKMTNYLNKEEFEDDYTAYVKVKFEKKFLYPFTSPIHVILCLLYSAALLAFFVIFLANWPGTTGVPFLWIVIAIAVFIFGMIVNWYVVAITLTYMTILIGLLVIIALILLACILVCILGSSSNSNTNNNRNYY